MNDMRKLMEAITSIEEGPEGYNEMEEIADELEDIKNNIANLIHEAANLVDGTNERDSARAYWVGHIMGALDNESEYMGGSMTTMQDTIDAIREEAGEGMEDDRGTYVGDYGDDTPDMTDKELGR